MNLVFLFGAIDEGIVCGAGMAMVGVILALVVRFGVFLLQRFPLSRTMEIMIINASNYQCEDAVMQVIKEYCKNFKVKSRTLSTGQLNLVLEFASDDERDCTDALLGIDGVHSVAVLAHDGEVTF